MHIITHPLGTLRVNPNNPPPDRSGWEPLASHVRTGVLDFTELVALLEVNKSAAVCWSLHASRVAAFQRIYALQRTKRFKAAPHIRFITTLKEQGNPKAGTFIMIHAE